MKPRVLLVDDEQNVLDAYTRHLRISFEVFSATSGKEGIDVLVKESPIEVVVSDFRMPEMNGVQFLTRCRQIAPDTVRIMLTGQADMQAAIDAINEGNLYRFLTKPCPTNIFIKSLEDAVEQYRLINAERELLDKTLKGSIKILIDILSVVNPVAFSQVSRLRNIASKIALQLKLDNIWEIELAAMLSQIGFVTIPAEILAKKFKGEMLTQEETEMLTSHPQTGRKLLSNIPRLEKIAEAIAYQEKHYDGEGYPKDTKKGVSIPLIARILKVALDYNALLSAGVDPAECVKKMYQQANRYDPNIFAALQAEVLKIKEGFVVRSLTVEEIAPGMVIAEDILDTTGKPLLTKGHLITEIFKMRLANYAKLGILVEPIKIIDRASNIS